MPLLLALTGCAARSDPAVHIPVDLVRPSCRPPAGLMAPPLPLPAIKAGDRMVDVSARDTAAFNALRRLTVDLQNFVREECADAD